MNIKEFLKLIIKFKKLIIAIPTVTLFITYFFVKNLPKEYKSEAKLSTGLLDPSRQVAPDIPAYSGPDLLIKINQQFTNIMDIMTMSKNMSILSYRLILHDLKNPDKPFKKQSDDVNALTEGERIEAIRLFEEYLEKKKILTPLDNYKIKLYNLVKSMGYDANTLSKKLIISHEQNSDFVAVEFTSGNTLLSVFVVNTLSKDFIYNYSYDLASNKNSSMIVLDSLLKKKEIVMNEKNQELKEYKIKNGVLNLDKQSQILYQQIIDNEEKKSLALITKESLQAALKNVNENLNSRNQDKYLGAELSVDNQAIIQLKNKLQTASNNYMDGGFRASDKKKVDSLQKLLSQQLAKTSDNYITDPLLAKQSLIEKRISIGIDLDKTIASIVDINKELAKLNQKFTGMVPFDAGVQVYERNADVATREYLEILNRYNQTNLDKNIGLRLHLEQEGVPSTAEPSKKILYMLLSAIASGAICFCVLFVLYLFDHSINNKEQLRAATGNKIIGELNNIKSKDRNIQEIWINNRKDFLLYKNQLRSARFEINKSLHIDNHKVLGITRLDPDQTGAFSTVSLAYVFARLGKRILLIGDEEIAAIVKEWNTPVNQSLKNAFEGLPIEKGEYITFLNKDLNGLSLLENKDKAKIIEAFNSFRSEFDLIIIHLDSINSMSDIKEWILFTDKYVATFMAGNAINNSEKEYCNLLNDDDKFAGWLINGVKLT